MELFYNLSLRKKITLIITFTVLFILGLGFGISLYFEISDAKERLVAERVLTAKIVSSYTVADLTFNNKNTALESLSYLKNDKSILNAYLFDEENKLFIRLYENEHPYPVNINHDQPWSLFKDNELHILEPINLDHKKIGSLYLYTSITDNIKDIKNRIMYLVVLIITLALISFVVAGKLSKLITAPILILATAARNFSHNQPQEFALETKHRDETGQLTQAFKEMLTQISRRENERDLAENKLRDNQNNLILILDNMVDAVFTINEFGTVLTMNKSAEHIFGYPQKELIGKNINTLMPENIAHEHNTYIRNYTETGVKKIIGIGREVKALKKNKESIQIRLNVSELPKDENGNRRFIGTCQDLTKIKQQEEQLQRSQKMDALGKLTGGIAHDFNNMLGVIIGYSELLESLLAEHPNLQKYAHEINHAGERGAKLTNKLLAFSRKKEPEASELNLNSILKDEQHMLEKTLTARIKLEYELAEDLWPIWVDDSDIEDAILNLCINAMHAIEGSGTITLQTVNETVLSQDAHLLNLTEGDYISLSIIDTGCGINNETLNKIFDPFFSTKGEKGTGLGLSQVYGFVKRSGGIIKVYSEPGHGTQFKLYFPRYNKKTTESVGKAPVDTGKLSGNESILIVDDEPSIISLSSSILLKHGYNVFTAENGQLALAILKEQDIDLVISDVIMPEMDGYQLALQIQEKYPLMNILLASGFTDNRHTEKVNDSLHRNLLKKPFNSIQLLTKVRELLD